MASPANGSDLSDRSLRGLSQQELTVGTVLLGDAWSILKTRITGLEAREAALPTNAALHALLVQVQCAMVLRVLNNPDGKLSETQDDYSYRLDSSVSTGSLYVSDAEIALLGVGDSVSEGAWTIKPAGVGVGNGYWSDTTTWVPLA